MTLWDLSTLSREKCQADTLLSVWREMSDCISRFPIELHIVHVKRGEADPLNTVRGLDVTGFFFEIDVRVLHSPTKRSWCCYAS